MSLVWLTLYKKTFKICVTYQPLSLHLWKHISRLHQSKSLDLYNNSNVAAHYHMLHENNLKKTAYQKSEPKWVKSKRKQATPFSKIYFFHRASPSSEVMWSPLYCSSGCPWLISHFEKTPYPEKQKYVTSNINKVLIMQGSKNRLILHILLNTLESINT